MEFLSLNKREVDIVIGNTNVVVGPKQNKWKLFVEDYEGAVKSIEVFLHPTFNPNHFPITERPFELESVGWGTFEIEIKVHFVDGQTKEYSHGLSFEDEPSMKSYTILVDNLPPPRIEQLPSDHPSLLPAIERKAHELRLEKRSSQVSSEEEKEKEKALKYDFLIDFSYKFYEMKPTKGNPTKKEELTIHNALLKYEYYRAICGDKRGRVNVCKAFEPENQRKILEFVRKTLKDLPFGDEEEEEGGGGGKKMKKQSNKSRRGRAEISFSFSQPNVMGGGFEVVREAVSKDGGVHNKILEVLEFVKKIIDL